MTVRIEMPQLSAEGEAAAVASWLVEVGDRVEAGDIIAELETDKSTVELESPAAGVLSEIVIIAGTEEVAPGTLLATLDATASSEAPSVAAEAKSEAAQKSSSIGTDPEVARGDATPSAARSAAATAEAEGADTAADAHSTDPRGSTPLARRAAKTRGLDLNSVEGSGPGGRIVEADVLRSADPAGARSGEPDRVDFETPRVGQTRESVTGQEAEARTYAPHLYLSMQCSMDVVMEVRSRLNAEIAESDVAGREPTISLNDFFVKAAALALRDVPAANARFAEGAIHVFERIDIGIVIATESGFVTPVARNADRKGLMALAREIDGLAERARSGRLGADEVEAGIPSVSNLGMVGIATMYPILEPPQACILGIGAALEQPVVRDGEVGIGHVAMLTLTADHRVIDGVVGARLLSALRACLEDPLAMMM